MAITAARATMKSILSAPEALGRLPEGNHRFVSGVRIAQGLGDLFVIRVAGIIVAPSQVGTVEFAAERFGMRLADGIQ